MEKLLENKNLVLINWGIVGYFLLLVGVNHYQFDFQLLGLIRELFTIPFILAAILFSVLGIKQWLNGSLDLKAGISLGALLICTFWILRSFLL